MLKLLTAQKMKFSNKNFSSKYDQIPSKLRIWPHLQKKSLMENFIFCVVCHEKLIQKTYCRLILILLLTFLFNFSLSLCFSSKCNLCIPPFVLEYFCFYFDHLNFSIAHFYFDQKKPLIAFLMLQYNKHSQTLHQLLYHFACRLVSGR